MCVSAVYLEDKATDRKQERTLLESIFFLIHNCGNVFIFVCVCVYQLYIWKKIKATARKQKNGCQMHKHHD